MPASFAASLCGFRQGGQPNTSDASDKFSIDLGQALFESLGVRPAAPGPADIGIAMRDAVITDLAANLKVTASHLSVLPERKLDEFEQYSHLRAVRDLTKDAQHSGIATSITTLRRFAGNLKAHDSAALTSLLDQLQREDEKSVAQRRLLLETLGEESVLGLDVTISRQSPYGSPLSPFLAAGFSLKWSLRTDRAQDCRSQGAKLAALRRGRMPHFAAITMEPRPYFLAILGRGSGDLDCVYHLHLPALSNAIDDLCSGPSVRTARRKIGDTFRQLCDQGRLRDYDDLVSCASTL